MKKFMVLLLAMALMVGVASMALACDPPCGDNWCTYDEFTANWEVVEHVWIGVTAPAPLVWDPCDLSEASQNFSWGHAANGCADFFLLVCMETFCITPNGCGDCDDPDYYPEFKVEMNGASATFDGGSDPQFHCACFGDLTKRLNCQEQQDQTGTLTILADQNTCTGYGTVKFSFTIFSDCYDG